MSKKYQKSLLEKYYGKILGVRNYRSEKDEFNTTDFLDIQILGDFIEEVDTGESDITPAGKAFLDQYYGLRNLSHVLNNHNFIERFTKRNNPTYVLLKNVKPMEISRFIEESRGNIPKDAKLREELLPPS